MARIEVVAHGTFEERCILWDDGQAPAEIEKTDSAGVEVVDAYITLRRFDDAEKRKGK